MILSTFQINLKIGCLNSENRFNSASVIAVKVVLRLNPLKIRMKLREWLKANGIPVIDKEVKKFQKTLLNSLLLIY